MYREPTWGPAPKQDYPRPRAVPQPETEEPPAVRLSQPPSSSTALRLTAETRYTPAIAQRLREPSRQASIQRGTPEPVPPSLQSASLSESQPSKSPPVDPPLATQPGIPPTAGPRPSATAPVVPAPAVSGAQSCSRPTSRSFPTAMPSTASARENTAHPAAPSARSTALKPKPARIPPLPSPTQPPLK